MGKFTTALAGALTGGGVDATLQITTDAYLPEVSNIPLFGIEPLPPLDDWAVLGISLIPLLVGKYAMKNGKNKNTVMDFGLGMALYSTGMIVKETIVRASLMTATQAGYTAMGRGPIPVPIYVSR